jgi:hypothetical protein
MHEETGGTIRRRSLKELDLEEDVRHKAAVICRYMAIQPLLTFPRQIECIASIRRPPLL